MTKVLFIKASPRTGDPGRSHSIAAAQAFTDAYTSLHPDAELETLELFNMDLPQFDGHLLNVKYNILHGREHSAEERKAWDVVETLIEQFKSADILVFAVPMWNFSIPYRLKQYIDLICQPTYTFAPGPDGYSGLVEAKAFVTYARAGEYPAGTPMEAINFQSPYMEFILGLMGVSPVRTVAVEPTLGDAESRERVKAAAAARAVEIAGEF